MDINIYTFTYISISISISVSISIYLSIYSYIYIYIYIPWHTSGFHGKLLTGFHSYEYSANVTKSLLQKSGQNIPCKQS